jgi:hypothetical protein
VFDCIGATSVAELLRFNPNWKPPTWACREYEQDHFILLKREGRELARSGFSIGLRRIVAKSQ